MILQKFKQLSLLLLTLLSFSRGFAQTPISICGTDQLHEKLLQESKQAREEFERGELIYREYLRNGGQNASQRVVKTIPVVVHIVQSSNQNLVTDADVLSQIEVLNEDFRKIPGTNGDGDGVDTEFEFCLATIDPNGCPTTGINRIINPNQAYATYFDPVALKSLIQWDPDMYLNIWVPRTIEYFGPNSLMLGYATFPSNLSFDPKLDGVVISSAYFGRNSDPLFAGRITTHEVGHWVGLFHTFAEGCQGNTPSTCNFNGDRVCDTPQSATPNSGCPTNVNSCVDFPVDNPDLVENYMEYTDGICFSMFTQGQKDRMESQMQTYRSNIYSSANLTATGCDGTISPGCVPTASFVSSIRRACIGQAVSFSDLSSGPATSWNWSFPGGTPATSTNANPTVSYPAPGVFNVSLTVTNNIGTDSTTESGYMTISAADPNGTAESFEGDSLYPVGWYSTPTDVNRDWNLTTAAASDGSNSMVMNNYNYARLGFTSDLNSTVYDFSNWASVDLYFDYAYKRYNAFQLDTFEVRVSTDCGASWQSVWRVGGLFLSTVAGNALNAPWVPTDSAHWKTIVVNLDTLVQNQSQVRLQFRSISGEGQNIHLDNIRFVTTSTGLSSPPGMRPTLSVHPNPFREELRISYRLEATSQVRLRLTDISGKVLLDEAKGWQDPGEYHLREQTRFAELPSGIYFLRLETDQGSQTRKLVKMGG